MNIPNEIIDQFSSGNGILFIGSGLSKSAGFDGWKNLKEHLVSEIEDCPLDANFQEIAQYYLEEYGKQRLVKKIRDEMDSFNLEPTPAHEALTKLSVSIIFTTNYDDLIEKALRGAGRKFDKVVTTADTNFWNTERIQLVKLYGDLEQPESLLITSLQYENYYIFHPVISKILTVALQTKTVLFIGYNSRDSIFGQLRTQIQTEAGDFVRNAYVLTINADKWKIKDFKLRKMQPVNIEVKSKQKVDL